MRVKLNKSCNVVTGEHSNAYRPSNGQPPRPQVTVPQLRLRLDAHNARSLAADLLEAARTAEKMAADYPVLTTDRFIVYCRGDASWLKDIDAGIFTLNKGEAVTMSWDQIKDLGYDDSVYVPIPV